jgi:hypothetical protein
VGRLTLRDGPASIKLSYDDDMERYGLRRLLGLRKRAVVTFSATSSVLKKDGPVSFRVLGLASVAVGTAALGLFLGRELRSRYKFKRRTPYDRYSHAGDRGGVGEFGMGI